MLRSSYTYKINIGGVNPEILRVYKTLNVIITFHVNRWFGGCRGPTFTPGLARSCVSYDCVVSLELWLNLSSSPPSFPQDDPHRFPKADYSQMRIWEKTQSWYREEKQVDITKQISDADYHE